MNIGQAAEKTGLGIAKPAERSHEDGVDDQEGLEKKVVHNPKGSPSQVAGTGSRVQKDVQSIYTPGIL